MSDHSGSYMLNDILQLMNRQQVFALMGKEKTQNFVKEVIQLSCHQRDCDTSEVLQGLTEIFELCSCCLTSTTDLNKGLCRQCRGEES